ncbi:neurotrypsin-like [Mytilus edulis]|uniref:neurotrypsin-like n=1 Tax=Mytilus edulis TaxID=6550 RepID=UPI0039EE994E
MYTYIRALTPLTTGRMNHLILIMMLATMNLACVVNGQLSGGLRILSGSTANQGRLEIYRYGEWGTVCDYHFDNNDAEVACRQLGICSGIMQPAHMIDDGICPIWLNEVNCTGAESALLQCAYNADSLHCSHHEDVGIHCFLSCSTRDEGDLRITEGFVENQGRLEIKYKGEWGTVSDTNFENVDAEVACGLRITEGFAENQGRLEVYYKGECGTLCDNQFANVDAEVACKQLGYCSRLMIPPHKVDDGIGTIWLNNVNCSGSESRLLNFTFNANASNCRHYGDVGIHCFLNCSQDGEGGLRITEGFAGNQGRLEINNKGEWGTLCDDQFENVDAEVACRQLGYWYYVYRVLKTRN